MRERPIRDWCISEREGSDGFMAANPTVVLANVLMANVLMANVLMANVLMANVLMANRAIPTRSHRVRYRSLLPPPVPAIRRGGRAVIDHRMTVWRRGEWNQRGERMSAGPDDQRGKRQP